jgi:hypothetical protein
VRGVSDVGMGRGFGCELELLLWLFGAFDIVYVCGCVCERFGVIVWVVLMWNVDV